MIERDNTYTELQNRSEIERARFAQQKQGGIADKFAVIKVSKTKYRIIKRGTCHAAPDDIVATYYFEFVSEPIKSDEIRPLIHKLRKDERE